MHTGYFITGTDTGVGKTLTSCLLLHAFNQRGLHTAAMKPVASGCHQTTQGWRNDDAEQLQRVASTVTDYDLINPYALSAAIAPHLAAAVDNNEISLDRIMENFSSLASTNDVIIVEGVGGWLVPLNKTQTTADLARMLKLPIIVVIGIRLGCINHALLTVKAIQQCDQQLTIAGWVANIIEPDTAAIDDIIATLNEYIPGPLLGTIPYLENAESRIDTYQSGFLDIDVLLSDQPATR